MEDDSTVAARAADLVLMSVDPRTAISPPYWRRDQPKVERFLGVLYRHRALHDALTDTWPGLRAVPTDWSAHAAAATLIESALRTDDGFRAELTEALTLLHDEAKMTPFRGARMPTTPGPAAAPPRPSARAPRPTGPHTITVVLDLRAGPGREPRLRNMLCVLAALHDQTLPAAEVRLVLVEQDETARHRDTLAPLVDQYIFVPNAGPYNRSWAHNVGAVHGPQDGDFLLFLDADFLIPRTFLEDMLRTVETTGVSALAPYRTLLYLDAPSTDRAITQRFSTPSRLVQPETLFGYLVRGAAGAAAQFVRRSDYFAIGGYDERFEGWGSEDYDFSQRLAAHRTVGRLPDMLVHLDHPISATARSAEVNAGREGAPRSTEPIGRLDRYAT